MMDGGLGNEVAPGDVDDEVHFRGKEADFTLSLRQPEPSNVVERSDEAAVRSEDRDYLDSSFDVISGILEGRAGNGSVGDGSGARFAGDAGNMVEELLVKKNYDGSNLPVVGMSNHREKLESRWTQWQPHFQLGVGSGSGSSHSNVWHRDDVHTVASPCENNNTAQNVSSSEFMGQGTSNDLSNEAVGQLVDTEHMEADNVVSRGGIRTKILSKSGFADFFIKNTLKGKGTVFRGHPHNVVRHEPMVQENGRSPNVMATSCGSASTSVGDKPVMPSASGVVRSRNGGVDHDGVSLREWLNVGRHVVDKVECFHIFRRIVDLVDSFHSKGAVLSELRPSCFKLLPLKQVRYLGSADKRDDLGSALDQDVPCLGNHASKRRITDQGLFSSPALHVKKQKLSENMNTGKRWPQFSMKYGSKLKTGEGDFPIRQQFFNDSTGGNPNMGHGGQSNLSFPRLSNAVQQQLSTCVMDPVEEKWYASPEELSDGIHTMSSNVYALGVLLFELLSHFDSEGARATAMSDLCNRILPPHFLSENLKEAGFCLLLLHPEPSSRPTTRPQCPYDLCTNCL
ncbi:Protein SPA1-RELATED 2 [Linum grandiflorum]